MIDESFHFFEVRIMKNLYIYLSIIVTLSMCAGPQIPRQLQTGWTDEDTYTVKAIGRDEVEAITNARHQILKDIVEVRVRNESRFKQIEIIQEEFRIPLQNGRIISRSQLPQGLEIYFQIYDKGLKKKFERR